MKLTTLLTAGAVATLLGTTANADSYFYTVQGGQVVVTEVVKDGRAMDRWIKVADSGKGHAYAYGRDKAADDSDCAAPKKGNNGHGNDADGNDNSNPGKSNDLNDHTDDDGLPGNKNLGADLGLSGDCDTSDGDADQGGIGDDLAGEFDGAVCVTIRQKIETLGFDAVMDEFRLSLGQADDEDDGAGHIPPGHEKGRGKGHDKAHGEGHQKHGDDHDDIPEPASMEEALEAFTEQYGLCFSSRDAAYSGGFIGGGTGGDVLQRIDVIVARRVAAEEGSTAKNVVNEIEPSETNVISLDTDFNGFIDDEARIGEKLRQSEVAAETIYKKLVRSIHSEDGTDLGNGGSKNGELPKEYNIGGEPRTESQIFWDELCRTEGLCAPD